MYLDMASTGRQQGIPGQIEGLSLSSWMATCRSHRWLIASWTVVFTIISIIGLYSITPRYLGKAELMLDTRNRHFSDFEVMSGPMTLPDPTPIIRSEEQVLKSTSLAGEVIDALKLAESPEFKTSPGLQATVSAWVKRQLPRSVQAWLPAPPKPDPERERSALIEQYLKRLTVVSDGRAFGMTVTFWATDPRLAATIVNTHVKRYLEDQHLLKERAAQTAMLWLDHQLERIEGTLTVKEDAVRDFREKSGLVNAQGSTVLAQRVSQVGTALSQAQADLAQRQAKITEATHDLAVGAETQSDVLNSLLIQRLRQQEADFTRSLVSLRMHFEGHSLMVQQAEAVLADVRKNIAQEASRIITSMRNDAGIAQQRVNSLSDELRGLQVRLNDQDEAQEQLSRMDRDASAVRSVYQNLLGRQQQVEALAGAETSDARLISPALPPMSPFFPRKTLPAAFGLVLAVLSGIAFAFVRDRIRGGVQRLDELSGFGVGLPLETIPLVSRRNRRGQTLPDHMLDQPAGEFADAMRSLRGDIIRLGRSDGPRVVAVTSVLPSEGKTTVALTMARSLASVGLRVLLIDCDLRRSRMADLLGIDRDSKGGMVAALQGRAGIEEMTVKDPRSAVWILPVGRRVGVPQDLLGTASLKSVLEAARMRYDFTIVDTPPEGAVSDVHLITPYVDKTILVVRWKTTPLSAVSRAITAFEKRGVTVDGILLNGVDMAEAARADGRYNLYRTTKAYTLES